MRSVVIFGSFRSRSSTSASYAVITGIRVGAPCRCGGPDEFTYFANVFFAIPVSRATRFFGSRLPTQRSRMSCHFSKLINPGAPLWKWSCRNATFRRGALLVCRRGQVNRAAGGQKDRAVARCRALLRIRELLAADENDIEPSAKLTRSGAYGMKKNLAAGARNAEGAWIEHLRRQFRDRAVSA